MPQPLPIPDTPGMFRVVFLLSALLLSACAQQTPRPAPAPKLDRDVVRAWNLEQGDVVRDPSVRYGLLDNGMRYAIQRNRTPQGAASIRLRIDMGSTAEADDQRGYAHFLEHMAFNGSTNVPQGEMIKILERYGLAFGPDTNASTSFTETVYKLDLPTAGDRIMDTGLMLMRETASELTLDQKAIERERGVILAERRARDQFALRRLTHLIDFAVPGTPVSRRMPIGAVETIETASAARIRNLYDRFYTPARATLIVTGDVDPRMIERKIRARFADWRAASSDDGRAVPLGTVDPARPGAATYFRDPAVPPSVAIMTIRPRDDAPDSIARRQKNILESLGNLIVTRRLQRIARAPDAPIVGGSASSGEFLSTAEQATLSVGAKDDDWRAALATGEQELRRALEHGFSQTELAEQIANLRNGLEDAAKGATTRRSAGLADALVNAAEGNTVVTTPAWRLAMFERFVPAITLQAVEAAFDAQWAGANPLIHVSGKGAIPDAEKTILAAFAESRAAPVTAYAGDAAGSFAYTDFGAPGRVVADTRIRDLGIRTLRFANNVRLSLKRTSFEQDRVRMSVRIGGGGLELPRDKPGLGLFMASALPSGGLEKHSFDALQSITAGRAVSLGLAVGADAFGGSVVTTPRDLQLQLQLFAAFITAPGWRPEGEAQWRRSAPLFYATLDSSPASVVTRDVGRILADGDPRFGVPPLGELQARSMSEAKAAIARALEKGAIEIAIVGDIEEQAAIDMVARTLGALPARETDVPAFAEARRVSFPANRRPITLHHGGKADEAVLQFYWPTTDDSDHGEDAALSLLAAVMQLRLTEELRQALGATYSPGASSSTSSTYPGYGQLAVSTNLDPKDIPAVRSAIVRIAASLAEMPVSADLLLRARQPILERIDRNRRENAAWLGVMSQAQTEPRWLTRFRTARTTYLAITPAQLQALAKRYLKPGEALEIAVIAKPAS